MDGPLHDVKPFTPDVRAEIDYELVDKSIDFMRRETCRRQAVLPLPAFLDGPCAEPSRQGICGQVTHRQLRRQDDGGRLPRRPECMDALKELGVDERHHRSSSLPTTAHRARPSREYGNRGHSGHGQFERPVPRRARRSDRGLDPHAAAFIRWPGHVKPDTTSYAMFSIMDFFPTLRERSSAARCPTDRPIDGVDQS